MIHQMAVPPVHTVRSIFSGHIHDLVASAFNILIDCNILTSPSSGLIFTRQHQNQAKLGIFFFHIQNRLSRKGIKSQCASRAIKHNALLYSSLIAFRRRTATFNFSAPLMLLCPVKQQVFALISISFFLHFYDISHILPHIP